MRVSFGPFPSTRNTEKSHANDLGFTELNNWLINAFNGEWLRADNPVPLAQIEK